MVTVPDDGASTPAAILSSVDFPAPFSPMTAWIAPGAKVTLAEETATQSPKRRETLAIAIVGPFTRASIAAPRAAALQASRAGGIPAGSPRISASRCPPRVANGPYRDAPRRPDTCAIHPGADAVDVCARCGACVCDGCAMPGGARVVCPGCTPIFGRRGASRRAAAAALMLCLGAAILAFAPLQTARGEHPAGLDYMVDVAARSCNAETIDVLISSLIMHGRDEEAVGAARRFRAACAPSRAMRAMIDHAERRRASPSSP